MAEPEIAQRGPYIRTLEAGTYEFCTCGRSAQQPFCDGSHAGTEFTPLEFTLEQGRQVALCGCKHTRTPPFCDTSHAHLD